jgi:hypothetical protein
MATTPNLLITHIETNQSQKEVTANEGLDILDEAVAGEFTHEFIADANYTLVTTTPDFEHRNFRIIMTDTVVTLTATRDVYFPNQKQMHLCRNETAQSLRFGVSGQTLVTVPAGEESLIFIDGSGNAQELANSLTSVKSIDLLAFFLGKPTSSQVVVRLEITRAFTFAAGTTGWQGSSRVASTSDSTVSLRKNNVEFATARFNISATPTFSHTGPTSFAAGDVFSWVGPASADASLEDISLSLQGDLD